MKSISRFLLKVINLTGISTTLACAYGSYIDYTQGHVVDADTKKPINGVLVSCIVNGQTSATTNSGTQIANDASADASYWSGHYRFPQMCESVKAVDPTQVYETTTVVVSTASDDTTILMPRIKR